MGSTEDFNVIICLKYSIETNFWMYLLKKKTFYDFNPAIFASQNWLKFTAESISLLPGT